MGNATAISWTDATWNPIRGCRRISAGCENCYAERQAARFSGLGMPYDGLIKLGKNGPRWSGETAVAANHLWDPFRWRKPRRIFTDSMSDLFYDGVSTHTIDKVVAMMILCCDHESRGGHIFQTLTKRPERMRDYLSDPKTLERVASWLGSNMEDGDNWYDATIAREGGLLDPKIWWGVSVEDQDAADERVSELLITPAAVRFLSCEPLLGEVDLSRWLGGSDVGQDQTRRGVRLRGSDRGGVGDRRGRSDMAGGDPARESLECDDAIGSVQTTTSGSRDRLPQRPGNDQRQEDDGASSSSGLVSLQGPHPGRDDGQPPERNQIRQSSEQSRTRDGQRADDPRGSRAQDRQSSTSERDRESVCETDPTASRRDSSCASGRSQTPDARGKVQGNVSAHIEDRPRRNAIGWIISGCESGPGARPCSVEWLRSLRDQCAAAGVPFFLKQAEESADCGEDRHLDIGDDDSLAFGEGSKMKARRPGGGHHIIELPYLDGVQHAAFPEVAP